MMNWGRLMEKEIIDFRSDTVTLPTREMLDAILFAKLGDDVYREDQTVNSLEKLAAEKIGKEAALLVTSGTQANLISLMGNTKPGNLVILEAESHMLWYEVGGISRVAGLLPWPISSKMGALDPKKIEAEIHRKNIHFAEPAAICIENTHNRHGGTIISPSQIKAISEVAHSHGLKLYMDGARIFNASIGLKLDVKKLTENVDNMMFCLSKGLCCPIGSILVGTSEFIERARKLRKVLGGGMRQAGIIAAPGILALEKMIDRLEEDHRNAKCLAEGISRINGIQIDLSRIQTNIVIFEIGNLGISSDLFTSKLRENGILSLTMGKNKVRMVTHRGVKEYHVEIAIEEINKISENLNL